MYSLFHLGAFAGMRRGELVGLSWDDVDLDNAQVAVHWQITLVSYAKARKAIREGRQPQYRTRTKTADGEGRTIDLDPQTVHELRAWRKQQLEETVIWGSDYQNNDNLVFTKENGEPLDPHRVYKAFVASVARLGLKPQPLHMLRHLAASLLIAAGVDIAIVSKRLGHSKSTSLWTPTAISSARADGKPRKQPRSSFHAARPTRRTENQGKARKRIRNHLKTMRSHDPTHFPPKNGNGRNVHRCNDTQKQPVSC
jgi:integrase